MFSIRLNSLGINFVFILIMVDSLDPTSLPSLNATCEIKRMKNRLNNRLAHTRHSFSTVTFAICILFTVQAHAQYSGRGDDAPWRATAAQKIDQNRKADLQITVQDVDGNKIENAAVSIKMKKHAFKFGSAVDPRYLLESQSQYNAGYAAKVPEIFNAATLENHLKWRAWDGAWGNSFNQSVTLAGLDWLGDREMDVRGHAMMWPRYQSVPDSVRAILDISNPSQQNLQDLYDLSFNHIADIGAAVKGKVFSWDMLNEPRTSFDIEDKLVGFTPQGQSAITSRTDIRKRWFDAAQAVDDNASMFLNDFGIVAGGDNLQSTIRNNYRTVLTDLTAANTPIDGLGFQSHFNETNRLPTSPTKIWELLDEFAADYDLPVHITEFDYNTTNKDLQADYTRDFMTAVFAHESVEAFILWGFWEGKINHAEAALFDIDFNPNLNGEEYLDLVFNQWWTEENGLSNFDGEFGTRGFLGDYEITVDYQGKSYRQNISLGSEGKNLIVSVPEPSSMAILSLIALPLLWRTRRSTPLRS